jgi:hypothetical protein
MLIMKLFLNIQMVNITEKEMEERFTVDDLGKFIYSANIVPCAGSGMWWSFLM